MGGTVERHDTDKNAVELLMGKDNSLGRKNQKKNPPIPTTTEHFLHSWLGGGGGEGGATKEHTLIS